MTLQYLIKSANRLEAYQKASRSIFEIRNYFSMDPPDKNRNKL